MIRLIQSLGVLALLAACGVAYLCARQWSSRVDGAAALLAEVGPVKAFLERGAPAEEVGEQASPLVAQAEAFAAYLNPPAPPLKPSPAKKKVAEREPVPAVRPVQATPKFTLRATSYSESRPEKSMALIAEPGDKAAYWVREGRRVGHVTIHEIKPGVIVVQAGNELHEMMLVRDPTPILAAGDDRVNLSSGPRAAATSDMPIPSVTQPSKRPTRRSRRTVGSARSMALR